MRQANAYTHFCADAARGCLSVYLPSFCPLCSPSLSQTCRQPQTQQQQLAQTLTTLVFVVCSAWFFMIIDSQLVFRRLFVGFRRVSHHPPPVRLAPADIMFSLSSHSLFRTREQQDLYEKITVALAQMAIPSPRRVRARAQQGGGRQS